MEGKYLIANVLTVEITEEYHAHTQTWMYSISRMHMWAFKRKRRGPRVSKLEMGHVQKKPGLSHGLAQTKISLSRAMRQEWSLGRSVQLYLTPGSAHLDHKQCTACHRERNKYVTYDTCFQNKLAGDPSVINIFKEAIMRQLCCIQHNDPSQTTLRDQLWTSNREEHGFCLFWSKLKHAENSPCSPWQGLRKLRPTLPSNGDSQNHEICFYEKSTHGMDIENGRELK